MNLGKVNTLTVSEILENGYLLADQGEDKAFLPAYDPLKNLSKGQTVEVFLYTNEDQELTASSTIPTAQLSEFAYLAVNDVADFGAFLEWGFPKELFVPLNQQEEPMQVGEKHPIFILKDFKTGRIIGSSKIHNFLEFDHVELERGQEVNLLLTDESPLGFSAIINDMYSGLIFHSDIHKNLEIGSKISGFVKQVREDGKVDLSLVPLGYKQSIDVSDNVILNALNANKGFLPLTDHSSPEEIKEQLGLSKKAFKRSVGNLYKKKIITLEDKGIRLV